VTSGILAFNLSIGIGSGAWEEPGSCPWAERRQESMIFAATARWNFRGETWFSVEIEAADLDAAGALFYSMLPASFFRGSNRLLAIGPRGSEAFSPKVLTGPPHRSGTAGISCE